MKKFHSNLTRIQRVQQQQLRIAELAVAQAQHEFNQSLEAIHTVTTDIANMGRQLSQDLNAGGFVVTTSTLHSLHARLALKQEQLQEQRRTHQTLEQRLLETQRAYRSLDARLQGLDEILLKRKQEHRREAEYASQTELEDLARMRRFSHSDRTFITSNTSSSRETE